MGWNPLTGEPWMALRCNTDNAYPALVGRHHTVLYSFQNMTGDFIVHYERLHKLGYILIWPEFARPAKMLSEEMWEKFGHLRAYLAHWAILRQTAPLVDSYYKEWLAGEGKHVKGLPLPGGFFIDRTYAATLRAPRNEAAWYASRADDSRDGAGVTGFRGRAKGYGGNRSDRIAFRPKREEL